MAEGDITIRGSPGYPGELDHAIWNKRLNGSRHPEAIVRVHSREEVVEAVRFAAANDLKVSPRGGGHHYGGAALRNGGVLLDLSALDFVEIDGEARKAKVGVGVRGDVLSQQLAAQGFAFPVGHCADVSVSGYLLNGGFGWNSGEWGAACTNVVAIEMVLADGRAILADESHYSDLFWAARGGGPGFFAVVTTYHVALHPLPAATCAWRAAFPADHAPLLADWLSAATDAAAPQTEVGCFLMSHWDSGEPAIVLRVSACGNDETEARERLSSFVSPPRRATLIGEADAVVLPFTELFKLSPMPDGKRVAADHLWASAKLGELLLAVYDIPLCSPHSTIDLVAYGGHSRVSLPNDGALSVGGGTGAGIYAMWDNAADDADNRAWVRRVDQALDAFRVGRYVGEADLTASPTRLVECFTPEALHRLERLRRKYDPAGVFFTWP
ncbi:MAG: FAD-binding oxidoreductase [Porphyrobacter sp.]|nr:FAD-binding oxidoreductase [Porphyrobacter sp.]